jgi:hypothetical protein
LNNKDHFSVNQGWKGSKTRKLPWKFTHFQAFTEEYWCVYISTPLKRCGSTLLPEDERDVRYMGQAPAKGRRRKLTMQKNKRDERNKLDIEENEEQEEELEQEVLAREPWSGEPVEAEDAPIAHVQGNWENNENFPLSDDIVSDFIDVGTVPDAVMQEMQQYTLDLDVQDDFEERQNLATDKNALNEDLEEHTHQAPKLSGGDVDAAWDYSDQSGEESVGGSVPTPDQDVVDELGEALGIEYADDEELDTAEKLGERDLNRWELNPASAQDMEVEDISPGQRLTLSGW